MTTFNIDKTAAPEETTVSDKPWFLNTAVGAVKLFPSDIGGWVELLEAVANKKVSVDELTITVKEVDFYNLRTLVVLNPALAGVKGTHIQLDAAVSASRFDKVGEVYVTVESEYFEEPLEASIEILKKSNNALLNKIFGLVKGNVVAVTTVSDSQKKERKALKAIPK